MKRLNWLSMVIYVYSYTVKCQDRGEHFGKAFQTLCVSCIRVPEFSQPAANARPGWQQVLGVG